MRLLRRLLIATATVAAVWAGGFLWFAANIHREVADPDLETDAIVVLTGGSGRLETGFSMFAEGRARKLFVSGVDPATTREQLRQLIRRAPERFECCVVLGHAARDTVGNAVETAAWMREQDYASLRLVTGSYHMPRSLVEFLRAMPDVILVPHPVFPEHVKIDRWWQSPGTAPADRGRVQQVPVQRREVASRTGLSRTHRHLRLRHDAAGERVSRTGPLSGGGSISAFPPLVSLPFIERIENSCNLTNSRYIGVAVCRALRGAAARGSTVPSVAPISQQIWNMKYRLKAADGTPVDRTIEDSWRRVADALAAPEAAPETWSDRFYAAMEGFRFLPAGRILAGAGTKRRVTLFNCFVMGTISDDMEGIFQNLKEAALTMQQGGGIGYDFSTLRPRGAAVAGVGADASGPLSFMDVWDAMCRTIMSAGFRRGAMMGTMRCDHPDIEDFIRVKRDAGRLRMFNLSVLATDTFMTAVAEDAPWELHFDGTVYKALPARDLWDQIMRATYAYAEPGVIFIDRINRHNNLHYCETINATNPCGEQPLPPYGACLLGSINLAALVSRPFEDDAALDVAALRDLAACAVRMLDNAIDISHFPLKEQAHEATAKRRIGLGVTGLADALILCGVRYGSARAAALTELWMRELQRAAYLASTAIAAEKGAFPLYEREPYLSGQGIAELDEEVRAAIRAHGIRNALLTSVAPTGTISIFADNVSSGLEPVFSFNYTRNVLMPDGSRRQEEISDYAFSLFRRLHPHAPLPDGFVDAQELAPADHVAMQAAVQRYVDSAVSKTINCPESIGFEDFKDVYVKAYALGCKGCTTYRPNDVTGAVLKTRADEVAADQAELPLDPPVARPEDAFEAGAVVYMTKPLDRPGVLPGSTYKIRWPDSDHAIYITINDVIGDGRRRPFEVFINSKNTEHFAWTVALTRMISAVFRRGGDVSFVVDELKAVFDPRGGQWVEGKYVPSLLAQIGGVIERHMMEIGFLSRPAEERDEAVEIAHEVGGRGAAPARFRQCPRCGQAGLARQEDCDTCVSCGYSKCS